MEKMWGKNGSNLTLSFFLSKHLVCAFVGLIVVSQSTFSARKKSVSSCVLSEKVEGLWHLSVSGLSEDII